jgi:hypothetical protein
MKLGESFGAEIQLSRNNTYGNQVLIVDGQGRSGKNLIAVVLSSLQNVEKMRLDSQIDYIPRYYFLGKMSEDAAITALKTEFDEKYYYNWISRDMNFRFKDYTGVFKQANKFRYFKRLVMPADEKASIKLKNKLPIFQEMTHDGLHVAKLYFKALGTDRLKMIHIFRDPIENIYEQHKRNFGTRIGNDPRELQLSYTFDNQSIPIIAIGREKEYIEANPSERLVLMVDIMFRRNVQGYLDLSPREKENIFFIEFEEFVQSPMKDLKRLESFLGQKFTKRAKRILKRENCPRNLSTGERNQKVHRIENELGPRYKQILSELLIDYDAKPWLKWENATY